MDVDDLLFLTPPPDYLHLKCPICYEMLITDPYLVNCCGHHYCGKCITSLSKQACPLCKTTMFQSIVDKNHSRALSSLKVYCTKKEKGCMWEGELGKLMDHTSIDGDCEYVEVPCTRQCGVIMVRSLLKNHEESRCNKRPATCQYCNQYVSTWEDVTTKHYNQCPEVELLCPNQCGESIKRKNQSKHLTACPFKIVKCEYMHCGCTWTGRQKDSMNHMETASIDHSRMLPIYFTKQLQKQQEISNNLSKQLKKQGDEIKSLKTVVQKQKESLKVISGELNKSKKEVAQITTQVSSYKVSTNESQTQVSSYKASTNESPNESQTQVSSYKASNHESPNELQKPLMTSSSLEDIHCDNEVQRPDTSLSSSSLMSLPTPTCMPHHPRRVFVPINKSQIATGGVVKSLKFFVGDPEYAMQLRIYPGGCDTGKGSHISIFLQLVPAVGDELRKWPYEGSVIVGVRKKKEYGVYEDEIRFDSSVLIACHRPTDISPGLRIEKFISHSAAISCIKDGKKTIVFYVEDAHL